jgi:hypothetical protein
MRRRRKFAPCKRSFRGSTDFFQAAAASHIEAGSGRRDQCIARMRPVDKMFDKTLDKMLAAVLVATFCVGFAQSRFLEGKPGGQCYDNNFLLFLALKKCVFLLNQCYGPIFAYINCV